MSRFLPSTKMNQMMEHLGKWAMQSPDDKTIIISQWTESSQTYLRLPCGEEDTPCQVRIF
ncbi:hypothetical protein DEU56DRAFT_561526 [Suillus clintonianus]|uniref:uncharacterized protein n=1 Tax=Suillus clintonianus TaxID=1904413 RepID=UPI001B86B6BD|nr:uncharacterized protein DEU56DRAFT_561526 [Suillus clintonianus]KAG2125994.1 hypothetical protein DEU56DRAFT_561526 [Suillus clintonianus]